MLELDGPITSNGRISGGSDNYDDIGPQVALTITGEDLRQVTQKQGWQTRIVTVIGGPAGGNFRLQIGLKADPAPKCDDGLRVRRRRILDLLAEFPRRKGSWRALCGNLVPPIGMVLFGWSFLLSVLVFYAEAFILILAVGLVMAVRFVEESHPRPWPQDLKPKLLGQVLWTWLAATAILSFAPLVGSGLLLPALGMTWSQLRAEISSEPLFLATLLAIVLVHGRTGVERLQARDAEKSIRDAVDDFHVILLRTIVLPVVGGQLLMAVAVVASISRIGQFFFLLMLALAITAGDVYRAEWLALFNRKPRERTS